ncbi:hypothetical protein ACIA8G_35945 [Lentzea sp. NPDC051213]|uniref:hypothetical protein n=1 Tax=Lentzea sp. NPDC051213 TaxID=3364126 RepID=UPI0037B90329
MATRATCGKADSSAMAHGWRAEKMQIKGNRKSGRISRRAVTGAIAAVVALASATIGTGVANAARTRVNCDNGSYFMITYANGNSRCYAETSLEFSSLVRLDLMLGAVSNFNVHAFFNGGACASLQVDVRGLKDRQSFRAGSPMKGTIHNGTWSPGATSGPPSGMIGGWNGNFNCRWL